MLVHLNMEKVVQSDYIIPILGDTQLLTRSRAKPPAEAHHACIGGID